MAEYSLGTKTTITGLRWRVENGRSSNIHDSKWLLRLGTFRPISPVSLPPETTIDYLLNIGNGLHMARLREHFSPTDVELILEF